MSRLERDEERVKIPTHILTRERERLATHKTKQHAIIRLQAAPLLQLLPLERWSFTPSCSRRTVTGNKSLLLPLACFVLSNLLVGWSSFVLRESRAESNRVDLGLAEMGRKAGVIALFDVDGTLTPARKVVAFYAIFSQFWIWCCWFSFFCCNYLRESFCGGWISRFVRSGYE